MTLLDRGISSRRDLLSLGTADAMSLLSTPGIALGAQREQGASHDSLSVRTFGAAGDATTDGTAAFQHTLDAAYTSGGVAVYVPPGRYLFKGTLTIPDGVSLRGSFGCVPSHSGIRDHGQPKPGDGQQAPSERYGCAENVPRHVIR